LIMKTKLHTENPFGIHPKAFLWEALKSLSDRLGRPPRHFDYGAHDGSMLRLLSNTGVISEGVGVDLNADVVRANQDKLPSTVTLQAVRKKPTLEYPDGHFDSVSIIGVLEHIHDQKAILLQLNRILKNDGLLVVAVPGRHLFSFLDMGNYKFVFPRVHRWFYVRRHGKQKYNERYVECRNGLIGDIEVEKRWHQHFSHQELAQLLQSCGFEVTSYDGMGFFNRLLLDFAYFVPRGLRRGLDSLVDLDGRVFDRAEIFVAARVRERAHPLEVDKGARQAKSSGIHTMAYVAQ
jgi:SAM-dependent methyltransferase